MEDPRKTSIEMRNGVYFVIWCDGSESEYQIIKEAVKAIEEDFLKYAF